MDAIKFLKEYRRMCNQYICADISGENCSPECALYGEHCHLACEDLKVEDIVFRVEKWSEKHPEKTILQDFLEKYPNAPLTEAGLPDGICPFMLGYKGNETKCIPDEYFCKKCWNSPLEE